MDGRMISKVTGPLFAGVLLLGCETTPTVTIPLNPSTRTCVNITYTRLCDSDIRARFPDIAPGDKILYSDSLDSDWPVTDDIWYTPDNVGPHTVRTKHVICIQYGEGRDFECRLDRSDAYYDTEPNKYLVVASRVSPDQAELIVKLWMRGKIVAKNHEWLAPMLPPDPRQVTLDSALLGGYTLTFRASGCAGPVHVRVDGEGDQQVLRVTAPPEVMCH